MRAAFSGSPPTCLLPPAMQGGCAAGGRTGAVWCELLFQRKGLWLAVQGSRGKSASFLRSSKAHPLLLPLSPQAEEHSREADLAICLGSA